MGRDIHVKIVKLDQTTNKWKNVKLYSKKNRKFKIINPYSFRNYELFDILNGKEDDKYILSPIIISSLPLDLQQEIKKCKDTCGYYGFYEINLADLKLYLNKVPKIRDYDYEDDDPKAWKDNPVKFFIENIEYYIDFAEPYWNGLYSNIRIIYWFDC